MTRSRAFMPATALVAGAPRAADAASEAVIPSTAVASVAAGAYQGSHSAFWSKPARTSPGALEAIVSWVPISLLIVSACLLVGCGSSTDTMQRKLDKIGKEDLQDILNEVPDKAKGVVLAKPYYKVDEFLEFHGDTAIVYQAKATLVFFYLDPSLDLCQVRKYRYKTGSGIWDRYEVKLMHFPKKYSGIETQ